MSPSQSETLQWTIELARAAGARLLGWFGNVTAERKSDGTLVTQADMDVDRFLAAEIRGSFPRDDIVSEELNTTYDGNSNAVWVFDPLDGTTNFRNGLPIWGVAIARIAAGRPEIGVAYFPALDQLFHAARGAGAFEDDEPLSISNNAGFDSNEFFVCCAHTLRHYDVRVGGKTRVLGSAVYDLTTIASGRARLLLLARPKIWDLVAGWLLVEEAGGQIETLEQRSPFPLQSGQDYKAASFPLLAASDPPLLSLARERIHPR